MLDGSLVEHGRNRGAERQAERQRQLLAVGGRRARTRSAQRERRRLPRRRRDGRSRRDAARRHGLCAGTARLRRSCSRRRRSPRAHSRRRSHRSRPSAAGYRHMAPPASRSRSVRRARGATPCVAHGALTATGCARRGRAHDLRPGDVEGRAHAGLSMAPWHDADRRRHEGALSRHSRRPGPQAVLPGDRDFIGRRRATAGSKRARVRLGLRIGGVSARTGGALAAIVWCARSERRCSGSLSLLVAGHAVALGHFALAAPGGVVRMTPVAGAARSAKGEAATVRAVYRNRAHTARDVLGASSYGAEPGLVSFAGSLTPSGTPPAAPSAPAWGATSAAAAGAASAPDPHHGRNGGRSRLR